MAMEPPAEPIEAAEPAPATGQPQLEQLRVLRAEVQDLQALLGKVRSGDAQLGTYVDYIQKATHEINQLLGNLGGSDSNRHLHNVWEQMSDSPLLTAPGGTYSAQDQLHHLSMLDDQCTQMVYQLGALTIPARLNDWLAKARPGYYIPFHAVFADELPVFEDRVRVLNSLAWEPKVIHGGLVDPATGLIYRYSDRPSERIISLTLLVVGIAATVGIVIGACFLPIVRWPLQPSSLHLVLIAWAAVLAGVIVHVGVSTAKRLQMQAGSPPVIAVGDLPLLISAKLGPILLKLLLALVGFFGLVFAAGVGSVTVLNAFLVGYSLDSVVELFSASLEQRATVQVATLKQQLGVSSQG